jgi:outer membrane protein W
MKGSISRWLVVSLVAVAPGLVAAEEVHKKWRFGASIGGYNPVDEIDSDAPNVLQLVDESGQTEAAFFDPRNDEGSFGNLDVQNAVTGTIHAQYALTPIFLIEGSIGYQRSDIGDVEMQAQFQDPLDEVLDYDFQVYRIPVGELERVPIELTGLLRFRPRARFNPYFGVGMGYSFVGVELDDQFNTLSQRLDTSLGRATQITSAFPIGSSAFEIGPIIDFEGASITAEDSFEWHAVTGAELSVRRKWHVFADLRWVDSSHTIDIGFNGSGDLGVRVPQTVDLTGSELASVPYGPVSITNGGLVDAGRFIVVPEDELDPTLDCVPVPNQTGQCLVFVNEPDGQLDPGLYYIQGGRINYDGFHLQVGFRFTLD